MLYSRIKLIFVRKSARHGRNLTENNDRRGVYLSAQAQACAAGRRERDYGRSASRHPSVRLYDYGCRRADPLFQACFPNQPDRPHLGGRSGETGRSDANPDGDADAGFPEHLPPVSGAGVLGVYGPEFVADRRVLRFLQPVVVVSCIHEGDRVFTGGLSPQPSA